jgi:hypothetical protein
MLTGTQSMAQGSPVATPGADQRDGVGGRALSGEMQMVTPKGESGDIFLRR